MKRLALLAVVGVVGLQAADNRSVFVNLSDLAERSKIGSKFQQEARDLQREVQDLAQKEQSKLAEKEKELNELYKSGADQQKLSEKAAKFEADGRRAQFSVEEKKHELELKLKDRQQKMQKDILDQVKKVAKAEGWSSVSDASMCLYVAEDLDKTDKVLEALNKSHDAEVAKAAVSKLS